jgi:hypothetical protein
MQAHNNQLLFDQTMAFTVPLISLLSRLNLASDMVSRDYVSSRLALLAAFDSYLAAESVPDVAREVRVH